ncbi:hypothetical protein BJ165DRAFT_1441072 [Panaeolus papilionaceus]|nr:hypothetical protein BJ165DRAFT_1441072 [Panaeolus papilionaceus]
MAPSHYVPHVPGDGASGFVCRSIIFLSACLKITSPSLAPPPQCSWWLLVILLQAFLTSIVKIVVLGPHEPSSSHLLRIMLLN